jgi:membrane-bound lytic murein transglycosylase A
VDSLSDKTISNVLIAAIVVAMALAALTFAGVIGDQRTELGETKFISEGAAFLPVDYAELAGWRSDDTFESVPALSRSCERMAALADDAPANPSEQLGPAAPPGLSLAGRVGDWRAACSGALRVLAATYQDAAARAAAAHLFYEQFFRPIRLYERLRPVAPTMGDTAEKLEPRGRFTGYFEPTYEALPSASAEFSAPVYARPDDLVMVDLGRFRPELAGQRIAGRVSDGALDPYPDHAAINAGALSGKAPVLAWMRPSDLLFLQIQGSGRLTLPDGEIRVGYDGANGRPYTAIGRTLIDMGALSREAVSMQTIREWLNSANEDDARRVRESNASYVFFRVLDNLSDPALGPLGAEEVQLTAGRSIAVDPRYTPFGAPVWVSIDGGAASGDQQKQQSPTGKLLIAQDAGGAIKGPVRGDIFFGGGAAAGEIAGGYNETGEMFLLLPREVADRLPRESRS